MTQPRTGSHWNSVVSGSALRAMTQLWYREYKILARVLFIKPKTNSHIFFHGCRCNDIFKRMCLNKQSYRRQCYQISEMNPQLPLTRYLRVEKCSASRGNDIDNDNYHDGLQVLVELGESAGPKYIFYNLRFH
jgi:hypothetical protein